MKLSQAKAIAKAAITVKTDTLDCVPYLVSGAGIGKTTVVHEISNELGIDCQILSLAQYDAGELAGWVLPNADGETMDRRCPDWMPRDGKGILFLDELPTPQPSAGSELCAPRPPAMPTKYLMTTD